MTGNTLTDLVAKHASLQFCGLRLYVSRSPCVAVPAGRPGTADCERFGWRHHDECTHSHLYVIRLAWRSPAAVLIAISLRRLHRRHYFDS